MKRSASKRLASLRKGSDRAKRIEAGANDGRFRNRAIQMKTKRDAKYKKDIYD